MTEFKADSNHSFPYNFWMRRNAKIGDILNFDKPCIKSNGEGYKYIRVDPKKNEGKKWKLME
jgi:hypothetical protein